MKTLLLGITGAAIASLCAMPAYADVSVAGGFNNGGTRVIVQFGNGGQYRSYDPHPYHRQSQHRDRYYQHVVPQHVVPNYRQPNYIPPNPYHLPTSSNPYNLPIVPAPITQPAYIYQGNPYHHQRHHHRY
jgi:hypothetical protein